MGTQADKLPSSAATDSHADAGQGLRGRLSSLVRGSEKVVDRIAGSVKDVARSGLLRQATDARERGNLAAAFWLLDEEFRNHPTSDEVARHFWDVAVEYGSASDAIGAIRHLIATCAKDDHRELASQYWAELVGQIPDAVVNAQVLSKILRTLEHAVDAEKDEKARDLRRYVLIKASQAMVHRDNEGLSPGIAFHLAEFARDFDRPSAIAAARVALESESLHEVKREHLMRLLDGEQVEARVAPPNARVEVPEDTAPTQKPRSSEDAGAEPEAPRSKPAETESAQVRCEKEAVVKHPLWSDDSKSPPLSDEEVAKARARISRALRSSAPGAADADREPVTPEPAEVEREPSEPMQLEVDPDEVSHPEIEIDPNEVSHPEIEIDPDPELPIPATEPAVVSERPLPAASEAHGKPAEEPARALPEGARFRDVTIMRGTIAGFSEDKISFSVAQGKKARVAYEWVQAIAVAEIGEVPGLTIDLLLNWSEQGQDVLRSVRLHADSFNALVLASEGGDASMELRDALAEILDRSRAVPLPDPDSVLGISASRYDSIEAYEREVLQLAR